MTKFGLVIVALLAALAVRTPALTAAPVDPYTENFPSNSANWADITLAAPANWVSSGGPDGSSYASLSANTASSALDATHIIYRGQDEANFSNSEFVGDWLAGGVIRYSMYVRHNVPFAVPYFVRFAQPDNSPGATTIDEPLVAPNTWTQLEWYISPNTGKLAPEGPPSVFNAVFGDLGHIQIGIIVPQALANNSTSYTYDLDQVSVSNVPEPTGLILAGIAAVCALIRGRAVR